MTPSTHKPFSILALHWKPQQDEQTGLPTVESFEHLMELRGDTMPEFEGPDFGPVHFDGPEMLALRHEQEQLDDGGESPFRSDIGVLCAMARTVRIIRR